MPSNRRETTCEATIAGPSIPHRQELRILRDSKARTLAADYPARILLAEDQPMNQKLGRMMLSKLGYQADLAENGSEAVEMMTRNDYDLIFMDLHMPVMDGIVPRAKSAAISSSATSPSSSP